LVDECYRELQQLSKKPRFLSRIRTVAIREVNL
jgi:hypothetical protein